MLAEAGSGRAGAVAAAPRSLGRCLVPPPFFFFLGFWFLFIKMIMKTFSERKNTHCDLKLEIIC